MLNVAPGCWDCSGESIFHRIHDKSGSGGAGPYPGTGASLLDKVSRCTRCTPAKVKINPHVIFLSQVRLGLRQGAKAATLGAAGAILPSTNPRLLRVVGPSHTLPLLLRLRFSFSDAEAELCTASPSEHCSAVGNL